MKKFFAVILALLIAVCALAACDMLGGAPTITFDAQNGTEPTVKEFDGSLVVPIPERDGYTFDGWYTDVECTEGNEWQIPTVLTKSITVYAKWTRKEGAVFVTFNAQGGTFGTIGGSEIAEKVVYFDENFALPANPTRVGYTFGGWFADAACTEGNEWTQPETLAEDITVYAKWTSATQQDFTWKDITAAYADTDGWNFSVTYVMKDADGKTYYDDILKYASGNYSQTYEDDGLTYTDVVAYDAEKSQYIYYYDNGNGTYTAYDESSDYFDYFFFEITYYVDLTVLSNQDFTESDGVFSASAPNDAGNAILGEWEDSAWQSLDIYAENGKITKIVGVQNDTGSETSGTYTLTITFSDYGNVEVKIPNSDDGGDNSDDNDEAFKQLAEYYSDRTTWNFVVTYDARTSSETWFDNETLNYVGGDFSWKYVYNGTTFVDYLAYDEAKSQYAYYYDNGDGTHTRYYSDDNADDFDDCYYSSPDFDLTVLGNYAFTLTDDAYIADNPQNAASAILGDWGFQWNELKIYVADGKISKIIGVMEDTSSSSAAIYNFNIAFSDYGKAAFTLPAVDDGDDSGESTTSKSVFTDQYLSVEDSSAMQYTASRSADGFEDMGSKRGVQFTQKNGDVVITSETAASGVTSVSVFASSNAPNGMTVSVSVGSTAFECGGETSVSVKKSSANSLLTFTSSTAAEGKIVVTLKTTGTTKSMYISYIEINGSGNGGGTTTDDVMPNQTYDESTFDNSDLQKKMMDYDESQGYDAAIGLPSTGTYNALVIPVQFNGGDKITATQLANLNKAMNGTSSDTGWESVNSFYQKSSFGNLNVSFDIWGVNIGEGDVFTAQKASDYSDSKSGNGSEALLLNALAYLENKIDLSKYDTNGDGCIDAVYLIYNYAVDYKNADFWWAYVTTTTSETTFDELYAYYYLFAGFDFMDEDTTSAVTINAETYIHETGHLLGLDDYYDYYENKGSNQGLGGADMMDYNIGDHGVYNKIMMGWMEPTIITTSQTFTIDLSDESTSDNCIMLFLDSNNSYFCEYLLIDLYSATGLNAWRSSEIYEGASYGVRIYHVSSAADKPYSDDYGSFTNNNNSVSSIALIRLVEADIKGSTKSSNYTSEADDLWQAGDTFGNCTNYTRNDGKIVNFNITIVSVSATTAQIKIDFVAAE